MQATQTYQAVSFWIGPQRYGFAIEVVHEVIRLPALIFLAGSPAYIAGMLNLHGRFLPVIDSWQIVAEEAHYHVNNQIILVGNEQPQLGLLVDQVEGVQVLSDQQKTLLSSGVAADLIDSVFRVGESGSLLRFNYSALARLVDRIEPV